MLAYIAIKAGQMRSAYRAAVRVGAGLGNELSILVFAGSAKVVTYDLDVEVELLVGGRGVLEDREPFAVVLADTEVDGGPVTGVTGAVTPLAALLSRNTGRVDVVLGGGGLALPVVVSLTVGASQVLGLAVVKAEGNGFTFSTCSYTLAKAQPVISDNPRLTRVVSAAHSDVLADSVLDLNTTHTRDTKLVGKLLVGQIKLATLTLDSTNGLASAALLLGPLGLLVTSGAGVRAHVARAARPALDCSIDLAENSIDPVERLDTSPATKAKVVDRNGTVIGGES